MPRQVMNLPGLLFHKKLTINCPLWLEAVRNGGLAAFFVKESINDFGCKRSQKGQNQPGQREKFAFFQAAVYDAFVLMIIITI